MLAIITNSLSTQKNRIYVSQAHICDQIVSYSAEYLVERSHILFIE